MDLKVFIEEVKKLGIIPTKDQIEKLEKYKKRLIEHNKKLNLTAITEEKDIYLKHFYDSLTVIKGIDLNNSLKVLDIGTGAGFPGIVLKIFFPKIELTVIDSNHKKIDFIKEIIKECNLTKIKCLHIRAEDLQEEYREYFDLIVSRAVAHLRILLELSIPYLKVEGIFIAMKGNIKEEVNESINTLTILKSKIEKIEYFSLPDNKSMRSIIKIKKEANTLKKYPRRYNEIKKHQL